MQSETNKAIQDKALKIYFAELIEHVRGGKRLYGDIRGEDTLRKNFEENCIPPELLDGEVLDYETFLARRRQLMVQHIKKGLDSL